MTSPHPYKFDAGTVGSSLCTEGGYISRVDVGYHAQGCGISTILTSLCFIDKDLNGPEGNLACGLRDKNDALKHLKPYQRQYEWALNNCRSLWYMRAIPSPKSGAYGYFNAALNCGYDNMVIILSDIFAQKFEAFGPALTQTWRGLYDPETGIIRDPSGDIKAWSGYWFFCN